MTKIQTRETFKGKKANREQFEEILKERKLKLTFERKRIYDEASKLKGHFDADGFYERFKKHGLRIARDTVYRTIPLLLESGVIQKSVGRNKREYYESVGAKGHHDHVMCVECGRIIEFKSQAIEASQEKICKKLGFQLIFHDHRIFGRCPKCRAK